MNNYALAEASLHARHNASNRDHRAPCDLKQAEQLPESGATQVAIEKLANLVTQVHLELSVLDETLSPFLKYPVPENGETDGKGVACVTTSPLIDQISTVYRMTQGLSERVRGLTGRVP